MNQIAKFYAHWTLQTPSNRLYHEFIFSFLFFSLFSINLLFPSAQPRSTNYNLLRNEISLEGKNVLQMTPLIITLHDKSDRCKLWKTSL